MILGFVAHGFNGQFITVEADVRSGLPGMNIVGLPDTAVKEAKERVRLAIKNSGFRYPENRIVVNLAPADVKKEGASFDMAICLAILATTGQVEIPSENLLVLGELLLSGEIRPVKSLLSALSLAKEEGISKALIPEKNFREAQLLGQGKFYLLNSLDEIQERLSSPPTPLLSPEKIEYPVSEEYPDFSAIKGQEIVKRVISIAVTGRHNLLLFGPPGCGKTYSCLALGSLLGELSYQESLELTRIWSQAGLLDPKNPRIALSPMRIPHHSATLEGMLGGGKEISPGEISLSHKGVLFLDEAPEFQAHVLQGLREPLETHRISLARANRSYHFPADFQLVMTANPCPCGNLGKEGGLCLCTKREIRQYWKRLGGALLDRTDLRLPVSSVSTESLMSEGGLTSQQLREQISQARERQIRRFKESENSIEIECNSRIPPNRIPEYCPLSSKEERDLNVLGKQFGLSSRAIHSLLKVARTISDLDGKEKISRDSLWEAVQYRRFGDSDIFWQGSL